MQDQQLNHMTNVMELRKALGGLKIIKALYDFSTVDWERYKNANTGDHLIDGVLTSGEKTDSVRSYTNKLVKLYLNSLGTQPSAWTKHTLTAENTLTKAIIERIAVGTYKTNEQLFRVVAGRIIGIDSVLLDAALATTTFDMAKHVVSYLSHAEDELVDDPTYVYRDLVLYIAALTERNLVDAALYTELLRQGDAYFSEPETYMNAEVEGVDLLEMTFGYACQHNAEYKEAYKAVEAVYEAQRNAGALQ